MPTVRKRRSPWPAALGLAAAAALVFGTSPVAYADPAPESSLPHLGSFVDDFVNKQLKEAEVPGAAVTIVSHGRVVYSHGYGYADLARKTPVDADRTAFYTASTAKLFTTAAALQLAADGELDMRADVNKYLGKVKVPNTYPGHPITMDNLLTHTAGFDPDYGMVGTTTDDPDAIGTLADAIGDQMPARVRPPGTAIAYDNYGFALAGYIVERVSGMSYDKYINTHVFGALDMRDSTASQPHPKRIDALMANGYLVDGGRQEKAEREYNPLSPAGPGQVTTAADMGRFMIDQLSRHSKLGNGIPQLMQKQHYTQDKRMPGLGYCYEERPYNGQRVLFKAGDTTGMHTSMEVLPSKDLGIFAAFNGDGNDDFDSGDLADAVIDKYFPAKKTPTPHGIGDKDVSRYAGTYQTSRLSHHGVARARGLTQKTVEVTANADGTLTTSGKTLSTHDGDTQKWVQIDRGLFQETNGPGLIAFDHGVLTESGSQNQVYLKIAWYERPQLHTIVAAVGMLGLLIGLIGWPVLAIVRKARRREPHPGGAKAARVLAWFTAAASLTSALVLISILTDPASLQLVTHGAFVVKAIMTVVSVAIAAAGAMVIATVAAWWRGWWRVPGRVSYTLFTLCALGFAVIAYSYNFAGPPFD
jgi:CubicO group peptidase (beta-lactamase class C family)